MAYDHEDDDNGFSSSGAGELRSRWVFKYRPADVLEAAEKKAGYHGQRLAWWKSESAGAEAALKEKGFEYRQRRNTRGDDVQIVGDPELARRVTYCREKIEHHTGRQAVFETWTRALRSQAQRHPDTDLELKIADVLFFGL